MKQDLSGALLTQFKALRRLYLGYLIIALLALILFFIDKRITFALLGLSLVYHLAVVRPKGKAYQKEYIHVCTQLTLERYLHGARHTESAVLAAEELRAARLVADNGTKGAILCREGGAGESKGRPVRLGDVTFTHSFSMEGKTHHEFATGIWVTVALGHDTGLDWRLIDRRVMMKPSRDKMFQENRDLQLLVASGPSWLAEDWLALRREGTPDLPRDAFLDRAKQLADYTPGAMAVCIIGAQLHVFITNRILGQTVSIREEPLQARVGCDRLPELTYILAMADQL